MKALYSPAGVLGGSGSQLVSALITGDNMILSPLLMLHAARSCCPFILGWLLPQVQLEESSARCQHCCKCFLVYIQLEIKLLQKQHPSG